MRVVEAARVAYEVGKAASKAAALEALAAAVEMAAAMCSSCRARTHRSA